MPTKNDIAFDSPPPGVGLNTVTLFVPPLTMSASAIWSVSCVLPTYVVVRSVLFHRTTEPLMNPVPLTVSVKSGPSGAAQNGLSQVMTGTGLTTANDTAFDVPPPGAELNTVNSPCLP